MKVKPLKKREIISKSKFRNIMGKIANSFIFEMFILFCIIINTICMAIEWYN